MPLPRDKMRRLQAEHPNWDTAKLNKMAEKLTNPEKMLEDFQSLLEVGQTAVTETRQDKSTFGETLEHTVELEKACRRVEDRFNPLANFRVFVFLKDLECSWMRRQITRVVAKLSDVLQYGPHQVGVAIGDVVLEWDSRGIVIPRRFSTEEADERAKFMVRVHQSGAFYERAEAGAATVLSVPGRKINYAHQEEVIGGLASHRERLVRQVVEVIVRYNTRHSYSSLCGRTSQQFVRDVLEALEITELPDFSNRGKVAEQFARLKKGKAQTPEYTHKELDEYVEENFQEVTADKGMLEYICNMYFHFHEKERRSGGSGNMGVCRERSCMFDQLRGNLFTDTIKLPNPLDGASP